MKANEGPSTDRDLSIPAPLLTSEVARILERSSETVRNLERAGVLKAVKTPTGVRIFNRPDVERLARRQRSHAPRPAA